MSVPGRRRILLAGLVGAGVLAVALANAHLVYVAIRSQPDCVAHVKLGDRAGGTASYSAAKPAC